jgi:ADP-ribosylglycohydrolase
MDDLEARIRRAWAGRISGCQLGKPVEVLSMREGHDALTAYLEAAGVPRPRDYIPFVEHRHVRPDWCAGAFVRSEPDDDVNYSVLALMMLEAHGAELTTADVARHWLKWLPVGSTYTAERAAYRILLEKGAEWFPEGAAPGFDLAECARNPYNDWIGAQIRADVYGWVCPGDPTRAARLAAVDASLSHVGAGIEGAVFVAAAGAALADRPLDRALSTALDELASDGEAAAAVRLGLELAGNADGDARIRERYAGLSPVATINNLALVVWALASHEQDFDAAIGDVVAAGLDTDCNGATVGALWGLSEAGAALGIPEHWTRPWGGRVGVSLAGMAELSLDELVDRTVALTDRLAAA